MRVLFACEETQEVCKAFRKRGHKAFSCDFLPCSGGHPEWHIRCDVIDVIDLLDWDLIISFPPCTDISVSGALHFEKKRADGSQRKSIEFFLKIAEHSNCIENPVGIMSGGYLQKHFPDLYERALKIGYPRKAEQIIQPHQFGEDASKATCLWLKGLPLLRSTGNYPPRIVNGKKRWGNQTDSGQNRLGPSETRGHIRAKTYPGIAEAMADQWG